MSRLDTREGPRTGQDARAKVTAGGPDTDKRNGHHRPPRATPFDPDFGGSPVGVPFPDDSPLPSDEELAPIQWATYRRNIDKLNRSGVRELLAVFGYRCPDHRVEAWPTSATSYMCKRDCRGTVAKLRRLIREDSDLLARHARHRDDEGLPW